jgi:hypothetical protein
MALALTTFRAQSISLAGPSRKRGLQRLVFDFTAAAADVTIDLGNFAGTFWTAISGADQRGKDILALVKTITANAAGLHLVESEQLIKRVQIATPAANGQFTVATITNHLPNITVFAGDGEASWSITVELSLKDGIYPTIAEYSANNT